MQLSIVIPYHDEGVDFISTTLRSIYDTIDIEDYEVIIVDDGSEKPLSLPGKEKVLRHEKNRGVGAAFDTGVQHAHSDNLFLMGSDIRFIANGWASGMLKEIKDYPKAFTCTTCVILNKDKMDIVARMKENKTCNGATILIFHDHTTNPRKPPSFKGIIEAKWLPYNSNIYQDSYEIPCILGAAYGVSKRWYEYVDGWAGHYRWGSLEPHISLKSWMFGGSCRIAPSIATGHIFKPAGTHGTPQHALYYNKIFIASVLLPDTERITSFFNKTSNLTKAQEMIKEKEEYIAQKRQEYQQKTVMSIQDFCKRWEIDYRE